MNCHCRVGIAPEIYYSGLSADAERRVRYFSWLLASFRTSMTS